MKSLVEHGSTDAFKPVHQQLLMVWPGDTWLKPS